MISISLCMIVKNEEEVIERCLHSIQNVIDEIIIVDTGSTDRTKEICSKFTSNIYDYPWNDNFSDARNYSFRFATMEYMMWLDADDIVLPEDNHKLQELKENLDTSVTAVMMKYQSGKDPQGNALLSYYRERLVKRACNFKWCEPVHEYLEISGNIINSEIIITHAKPPSITQSSRNINIYEKMRSDGIALSSRGTYYYARELKDHNRIPEAIIQFELFLNSGLGWKEDNIAACGELAKCYQLNHCPDMALQTLFRSFVYDLPRAEICCQIGYWYKEKENYVSAAFWFKFILSLKKPENSWGFLWLDCWDFVPLIECSVCYDRLGDYQKAEEYNNRALIIKPDSIPALNNKDYFNSLHKS